MKYTNLVRLLALLMVLPMIAALVFISCDNNENDENASSDTEKNISNTTSLDLEITAQTESNVKTEASTDTESNIDSEDITETLTGETEEETEEETGAETEEEIPYGSQRLSITVDPLFDISGVSGIGACEDTEIIIPYTNSTRKYNLTYIERNAFSGNQNITDVIIHENITIVNSRAFDNCPNLKFNEYDNAYYLGDINNPYRVLVEAKDTSITTCEINADTKVIAGSAFSGCSELTSIIIPDGMVSICEGAFNQCKKLETVTLPNSLTYVGRDVFSACSKLEYTKYGNLLYLGNSENAYLVLVKEVQQNIESCNINNATRIIAGGAFSGCALMREVVIPEGVTHIGEYAFNNMGIKITFPASLRRIERDAFYETYFSEVHISDVAAWCNIDFCDSPLAQQDSVKSNIYVDGQLLTHLVIPDGVAKIPSCAFFKCINLKSITIPDSVTYIGSSAFYGCSALESIIIPESVKFIGKLAFAECKKLVSVTFEKPNGWYAGGEDLSQNFYLSDAAQSAYLLTDVYDYKDWENNK